MPSRLVQRVVLILVLMGISALFTALIWNFLMAIFLAALFSALFTPLYRRLLSMVGDREAVASLMTILTVLFFVFVPFALIFGTVATQALEVAESTRPWIQGQISNSDDLAVRLQNLPFYDQLEPYRGTILSRLGELAGSVSGWTVNALQTATLGTFSALLTFIIILYTMFFFLIDGDRLLYYILYYLPLHNDEEAKLLGRFMSVTRATLKGTAVIGFLQGSLAGLALWMAGVPTAMFWAVAMMFLSVVPGIGTAIVWAPAAVYLAIGGDYKEAIGVVVFCSVVVGAIDNLLRPKLVGNDTQLHELMIFFSTLGGLVMFGFMGFVIGPIIAALFVTTWELYGDEFKEFLPYTAFTPRSGPVQLPDERFKDFEDSELGYFDGEPKASAQDDDPAK